MESNFILTDVMKTGDHLQVENFFNHCTLKDQKFTTDEEYYSLQNYDLDSYDRRIALIDVSHKNYYALGNSGLFANELENRLKLLHSQGFKFIQSSPWESHENLLDKNFFPRIEVPHMKWTGDVSWFWFYMYNKHKDNLYSFNHETKPFDFLYLNKRMRDHRIKLFKQLENTNLLENSIVTNWPNKKLPPEYELPWAQDYPMYGRDQDIYEKPYNDTKFSIISETNDNSTNIFMTEKIWKPIIAQQLFVVHGNHLYLQKLREIGFKTFANIIDESYDIEMDADKRIEKLVNTIRKLKESNWEDLYLQSQATRKHNFDTLFNSEKLSEQVNKTINLFFEFVDSGQVTPTKS